MLREIADLHEKKQHDYAQKDNPFSNFEHAALVADVPVETVFRVLLGIKDARIINLLKSGSLPLNESLEDSIQDRATYTLLWLAYRIRQKELAGL